MRHFRADAARGHSVTGALLAKSSRAGRSLSLLQHLSETADASSLVFRPGSRQAERYLRFFKLPADQLPHFLLNLRVGCLFHDLGKANEAFQNTVRSKVFVAQPFRHEHLSALLLSEPTMRRWLMSSPSLDVDAITAAVLSHHLKASSSGDWQVLAGRSAQPVRLHFDDRQVKDVLTSAAKAAGLPDFTGIVPSSTYVHDAWQEALDGVFRQASTFAAVQTKDPARWSMMLAIKAGLIVADSVASGLWREDRDLDDWITSALHRPAITAADIEQDILGKRKAELGSKWQGWHGFQEGAATVGRRGLLLAGCGAGKTLAAWRWAQAVAANEQVGRVIFLDPTRGTATEGFRDYVAHAPEGEAALVHGTSTYELQGMLENPPESMKGKVFDDEAADRLFAMGLWDKRYFSATVDQFLGFIEHSYGGLCLLPALADAAVVFDEVHSYDPRMWNALVTFLKRFDIPVLCMTATLPAGRRQALVEACGLQVYPSATQMADLQDLEEKETRARYRHTATSRDEALKVAVEAVNNGERVLWVVNTVKRCQQLAHELASHVEVKVGVYHSRFKLRDRQQKHRKTVDAFKGSSAGAALAVTTQVCEMNLDLDADVLITEHAPISSLVQRFGRANRHLKRPFAQLLTYAAETPAPYDKKELVVAATFLTALGDQGVSQRDLSIGLEKLARQERTSSGFTAFVDSGYYAVSGSLRDSDDVGAPVVLDGDVAAYVKMARVKDPARDGLVLSVPRKKFAGPNDGTGLPTWLKVADGRRYDAHLGFIIDDDLLSPSVENA